MHIKIRIYGNLKCSYRIDEKYVKHNITGQDTNYSIGGMVINTQDTSNSIGEMVINAQDTNYSIGGMVINTQDTNYSIGTNFTYEKIDFKLY